MQIPALNGFLPVYMETRQYLKIFQIGQILEAILNRPLGNGQFEIQIGQQMIIAGLQEVFSSADQTSLQAEHTLRLLVSAWSGELSANGDLTGHLLLTSGLRSADTIMVGHLQRDTRGARRSQVLPAGVLWCFGSREELMTAGAERLFEQPKDLERPVL